jgi:hypothetical protein
MLRNPVVQFSGSGMDSARHAQQGFHLDEVCVTGGERQSMLLRDRQAAGGR